MANLSMGHGVSGCFGTRLAPKIESEMTRRLGSRRRMWLKPRRSPRFA